MIRKKSQYFIAITIGLFLFVSSSAAQKNKLENLSEFSEDTLSETIRKIQFFTSEENKDSLQYYVERGYDYVERYNFVAKQSNEVLTQFADIYFYYGEEYYETSETFKAIIGYKKAAELYEELGEKSKLADAWSVLGILFSNIGDEAKCIHYLSQSIEIYIDLKDSVGMALGFNSMGEFYSRQNNFSEAQNFVSRGLEIGEVLENHYVLSILQNTKARIERESGDYKEAIKSYQKSLSYAKLIDNEVNVSLILNNLGSIYVENDRPEEGIDYLRRALNILNESNFEFGKTYVLTNMAKYYILRSENKLAQEKLDEAIKLAIKTDNPEGEFNALKVQLKIYEQTQDQAKIAEVLNKQLDYYKLLNKNLRDQLNRNTTVKYKLEKEKYKNEYKVFRRQLEIEKERDILSIYYTTAIIFIILLVAFLLFIIVRLNSSNKKNKIITKQSEERKLLLQEVHHRVKNNFQIVSSMLRLQSYNFDNETLRQNFEEAVNRINAMAIVHDVIYRQEKFKDIDSKRYLEKLIKSLRKSGDSRILITIDSEEIPFKIETLINIGIALNELITNSFKHAFNHEIAQPKIEISLREIGDKTYELVYKDNGVGISKGAYESSFGMELIETIISNFEGEVTYAPTNNWSTLFKITFKED